jgi:hypothetical protein
MGLGAVAAATVASGVIGAGTSLIGSSKAAGAAKDAADLQRQQYERTRGDLAPFVGTGANALSDAYALAQRGMTGGGRDYVDLAYQHIPGQMTQAELEATPGYQFTLGQGLKAAQSAAAARGLGVSGAALKGAATYATGLADSTYKTQFDVAQQRFNDYLNLNTGQQGQLQGQYNRLAGIGQIGANAAAGQATAGTSAANTAGNYLNQAGLADAAGARGVGNAITGAANNYLGYDMFQQYMANKTPTTGGYASNISPATSQLASMPAGSWFTPAA